MLTFINVAQTGLPLFSIAHPNLVPHPSPFTADTKQELTASATIGGEWLFVRHFCFSLTLALSFDPTNILLTTMFSFNSVCVFFVLYLMEMFPQPPPTTNTNSKSNWERISQFLFLSRLIFLNAKEQLFSIQLNSLPGFGLLRALWF